MYKPTKTQLKVQAERRKNVDLRLIVGFLITSVRWLTERPDGPYPCIVEGHRTAARQAILYAQGRTTPGEIVTNLPAGRSKHEYGPSKAIDIGFWMNDGELIQDSALCHAFYQLWREHTVEFIWGGNWKKPVDGPHFEVG